MADTASAAPSPLLADPVPLRAEGLVVGYSGRPLLPPVTFDFRRGQVTAILGRNGAGKSTLLKTLLGELKPVAGRVVRSSPRLKTALMPQTRDLDFQLPVTVREFASWGTLGGLGFMRRPWASREECRRVDEALEELGLSSLGGRFLRELSEGQKQRVLFARILATDADVALLDEPTAAMDAVFQKEVLDTLRTLADRKRMAVAVVTHALELVGDLTDSVIFLDAEEKAAACGSRDQVLRSEAFRHRFQGVLDRVATGVPETVANEAETSGNGANADDVEKAEATHG